MALLSGRHGQAYRFLLLAQPELGKDPAWLDLAARVYLALDRPGWIAEVELQRSLTDPAANERARLILERTGNGSHPPSFQPKGRWPGFDKRALRSVKAVAPGEKGTAYLLTDDALLHVDGEGRTIESRALPGARDLCLDVSGSPFALGEDRIVWGKREIRLPQGIVKAISAAPGPNGSFFVLERGEPRVHRVNLKGASMGIVSLTQESPSKIRVDLAGRILISGRSDGQVRVYAADMAPVKTLILSVSLKPLHRIEDLSVDLAGNLLVRDGSTRQAYLFTSGGQLLTSTGEGLRAEAAGWDGLGTLLVVDGKEGALWRYGS